MECTNALTADRIVGHVETAPKGHRLVGIENCCERLLMDVAQRTMKEAGTHCAIRLDDGGDPGRIADGSGKLSLPTQGVKVLGQLAEFVRALGDEPRRKIRRIVSDDLFDNTLE